MAEQVFSKRDEFIIALSGPGILRKQIERLCIKWDVTPKTLHSHNGIHQAKTLKLLAQHILDNEIGDNHDI